MSLLSQLLDALKTFEPVYVDGYIAYVHRGMEKNTLHIGNLQFIKHADRKKGNSCLIATHHDFHVEIYLKRIVENHFEVVFNCIMSNRYFGEARLAVDKISNMESRDENIIKQIILDVMGATHSRYLKEVLEIPVNE